MLFATLPMYSAAPFRPAWQLLWEHAAAHLNKAGLNTQKALCWPDDPYPVWQDDAMILGHTCGWPLVSRLGEQVVPFARFDFGLPAAPAGHYHSVFIARQGPIVDTPLALEPLFNDPTWRIAINGTDSQSGFRVLGECLGRPYRIAGERVLVTGSHASSIDAVAAGQADLAAIDAVTWQYALDHQPSARALCVLARSADVPGLPLVTSGQFAGHTDLLRDALRLALRELSPSALGLLRINGLVTAARSDYQVLRDSPFGRLTMETDPINPAT